MSHDSHELFSKSELMPTEDHSVELGHVQPQKVYLLVLLALLVLTFLTVFVTRFDFGVLNMVVAMGIASLKAVLVALFFMHLKYENKFVIGYAIFPLVLLALLIGGVMTDNPFRVDSPMTKIEATTPDKSGNQ